MRILVVLSTSAFFRHFETVVGALCAQGHDVKVLTRMVSKGDADEGYQAEMVASVAAFDRGSYDFSLRKRRDRLAQPLRLVRDVANFAVYSRRQHTSPQLADRVAGGCPAWLARALSTRAAARLLSHDRTLAAYRRLQALVPPDPRLLEQLAAHHPDVVVGCPFIYPQSADLEYLRAARRLGIPTVAAVASWDNLSTKGTFHLLPDGVLAWNERLADEAASIHALPPRRIAVTGAPKFDGYFGRGPSLSRADFCARLDLPPQAPYLLYLGSSEQIAGDETAFVGEIADALAGDPRTREVSIVVRPHPLNAAVWRDFDHARIRVFPRRGQRPDLPGPREDYLNSLGHAAAAMGVNTTAFLEAAIADRPCLSVVSPRHRTGQRDRSHFQHLVQGGFLETVPTPRAAADALAGLLAGHDPRGPARRRFVEAFVRPAGAQRLAGEVTARAIVRFAREASGDPSPASQPDQVNGSSSATSLSRGAVASRAEINSSATGHSMPTSGSS